MKKSPDNRRSKLQNGVKLSIRSRNEELPVRSASLIRRRSHGSRSRPQTTRSRNQSSEEQLMQLGAQIAFENYRVRWNRIFNGESDNLYQGTVS